MRRAFRYALVACGFCNGRYRYCGPCGGTGRMRVLVVEEIAEGQERNDEVIR